MSPAILNRLSQTLIPSSALDTLVGELNRTQCPPVELISAGGFISTVYFQSRHATEDLDFFTVTQLSETEIWIFYDIVSKVTDWLSWNRDWMNTGIGVTIPNDPAGRKQWIDAARAQNVVLYRKGKLTIYAAPWEWCISSKLKRMGTFNPFAAGFGLPNAEELGRKKMAVDIDDLVVLFNQLYSVRKTNGQNSYITKNEIREWYTDGPPIMDRILNQIEATYEKRCGVKPFI
jgi:hypothetical protein